MNLNNNQNLKPDKLIRNVGFGPQGPPGGDDEDLGGEVPEAEIGCFSTRF